MTILVGVRCSDGVVIGSDGIATSSNGLMPVMQVQSNDKIKIFSDNIIVATTGAVGSAQRLYNHVEQAIKGNVFKNLNKYDITTNISKRLLEDFRNSNMPINPHTGFGFGALMAAYVKGEACLVEYATNNFQPEFKENKLFYVSIGSGQALADPFLAFVNRVLWKGVAPDIRLGKLGVYWALCHTIRLAAGMVGEPIKIAVLSNKEGNWSGEMVEDTQEIDEHVGRLENQIGNFYESSIADVTPVPIPALHS